MPRSILSVAEMRAWESATWSAGRTETEIIDRVGAQLACAIRRFVPASTPLLLLAGKGHNGDDVRALARHLNDPAAQLLQVADPTADLPALAAAISRSPSWIVDGLFGIGLNRPIQQPWAAFFARIQEASVPVIAIDVPSGLDADTGRPLGAAIRADLTLTLGAVKTGLLEPGASAWCGRIELIPDIGLADVPLPGNRAWVLEHDFHRFPPPRPVEGHKGHFGHTVLIAGSLGYHGAAVLAARGALRTHTGLVTVLTTRDSYVPVAAQLQSAMVQPWSTETPIPPHATALCAGPGLAGPDVPSALRQTVAELWNASPLPMVVDASTLDWLPIRTPTTSALRLITPHPGEAARLLGTSAAGIQADRPAAVRALSARYGRALVVLKGQYTLIGRRDGALLVNSTGNPDLAKGGSGDLLAGFIAGWLASLAASSARAPTPESAETARLLDLAVAYAVWQHGHAADRLSASQSRWTLEDLAQVI